MPFVPLMSVHLKSFGVHVTWTKLGKRRRKKKSEIFQKRLITTNDVNLNALVIHLRNSSTTRSFGEYLDKHWVTKKAMWGYCFRTGDGINTNMYVEAFHRVFKYNYLHGKYNRQVDMCLFTLIKFNRDKVLQRLIKLTKGINSYRKNLIYTRHVASTSMALNLVETSTENKWTVKSKVGGCSYVVIRVNDVCDQINCQMRCSECSVCSHIYNCGCIDFLKKNIPCKHIHIVERFQRVKDDKYQTSLPAPIKCEEEIEQTINLLKGCEPSSVESLKKKISFNLTELFGAVGDCTILDEAALKSLDNHVVAAKHTFLSLRENRMDAFDIKIPIRGNKNTEKQQKFVSKKAGVSISEIEKTVTRRKTKHN